MGKSKALKIALYNKLLSSHEHLKNVFSLPHPVVKKMRDDGAVTPAYAQEMLKAETWGTDREIQRIAAVVRRQVTVVVMRPREGEEVVQVFTPEHHDGSITIIHRPGHLTPLKCLNGG